MKSTAPPTEQTVMTPEAISLAAVYAEALADSLDAKCDIAELAAELAELAQAIGQVEGCGALLADATMNRSQREEFVERVFTPRVSPPLASLLGVLASNNRLALLSAVAQEFQVLLEKRSGCIDVHTRVAVPLDDEQRDELAETLSKAFKLNVNIVDEIDPAVIGGMVIRVGDTVYDASLAGELQRLAETMGKTKQRQTNDEGQSI